MTAITADIRDTALTYAAGDVVGYISPLGVTPPVDADVTLLSPPWYCLGWLDTTGVNYKPTRALKEVTAAGSLSSIRTIVTSEVKSLTCQFLEPMNPWVRALFDDVPIGTVSPGRVDTGITLTSTTTVNDANAKASDVGKTITATGGTGSIPAGTTIVSVVAGVSYTISAAATAGTPTSVTIGNGANKASYILPEVRQVLQYAFCFDSFDGDKKVRLFGVRGQVNNPGDEVLQQADNTNLTMEITFYPDNITLGGVTSRGTMARYLDYGAQVTGVYIP